MNRLNSIFSCAVVALSLTSLARAEICDVFQDTGGISGSNDTFVTSTVMASGGGLNQSTNHQITPTSGQPSDNKSLSSLNYQANSGFWNVVAPFNDGNGPVFGTNSCSGEFLVTSLPEYQQYVDSEYGSYGAGDYQSLRIMASLSQINLKLVSPCTITIDYGLSFSGDRIVTWGREGLVIDDAVSFNSTSLCLHTESGDLQLGDDISLDANNTALRGSTGVDIGKRLNATSLDLMEFSSSLGSISMAVAASLQAGTLLADAKDELKLDKDFNIGTINKTELIAENLLRLGGQGAILSGGDLDIISAGVSQIQAHVSVSTPGNLTVTALQGDKKHCKINRNTNANFVSVSGNCQDFIL